MSEGEPPFNNRAAVELVVKASIRSAIAEGFDLTFISIYGFALAQARVEFVSNLLKF
jgi:hypothetical protein